MAYAFSGPRWDSTRITWSFAATNYAADAGAPFSQSLGPTPQNDVRTALATWGGVAGLDFVQVADSPNAHLRFGWGMFGASSGTVGETAWRSSGTPAIFQPDVIIRFEDPSEKPLVFDPSIGGPVYSGTVAAIASVVLHEIGHGLGLGHNNDATSIMFPTAGVANRQLNFDDKFSIQLLYGDFDQNFRATNARDVFYGFAGTDQVTWNGKLSEFTIARSDSGHTVSRKANPADRDTVFDVEFLQFTDTRVSLVADSGLFDPIFYARAHPDVLAAGVDPRQHFDTWGWREGRAPNAVFDPAGYLSANPDVRAAGVNPLGHYESNGWREGRDPAAAFDARLYLARHPDVAGAGVEPLTHYLLWGRAEGRAVSPAIGNHVVAGFDAQHYLLTSPDVGRPGVDPYRHWQQHGRFEGRTPDAYFDTQGYLARYTDVAAAGADPLAHYMANGWREGRDPSAGFDTWAYLASYPDVAGAGMNPLDHYLRFGALEGRLAFGDGAFL